MRKSNPNVVFLKDIENRDPILTCRFHADINTVVFGEPITQFPQSFCKSRETSLLILCAVVGIGNADTGKDSSFVNIKSTAVFLDDFEQYNNLLEL